jgi:transposase-like protein
MGKERTKVNADRKRQRFSREFKLEALRLLDRGANAG